GALSGLSLSLPVPDGRSRAVPVTPANIAELRRRFPVLALLRRHGDRGHEDQELAALELVAQALEQSGVGFALVDPERDPELARELGEGPPGPPKWGQGHPWDPRNGDRDPLGP
ncbi:CASQ1 protein, partial [Origma solitaria]|nr:CASQ1 protein [Origma solitaria]